MALKQAIKTKLSADRRSLRDVVGRRQVTHDYTKRYWGHDYVFHPESGGLKAHMMGWGHGLKAGHFLILQNGAGSTRYQIKKVKYFDDPPDMWDASVVFSPRQPPNKKLSDR